MNPEKLTSAPSRADSYHHGDLRAALLNSAKLIVERDGPDAVSLRGVAEQTGVSRAAPYHHFKGKQALLAAVAAEGFRELTAHMLSKIDPEQPPRKRLDELGYGYVEFGLLHPSLFRLMQGPKFQKDGIDLDLDAAREKSAAPLIAIITECMPGASQTAIMTTCAAAWSMVHGMATLCIDGRIQTLVDIGELRSAVSGVTSQLNVGV